METKRVKQFVTVNVDYMADGSVCPHSVILDGRYYHVDRVIKVEKSGNVGSIKGRQRFHVVVGKTETSLYLEDNRWYVRKKV